jgi:endoglucanase
MTTPRLLLAPLVFGLCSFAQAQTSDCFFSETFDAPSTLAATWSGSAIVTETHSSGHALKVSSASPATLSLQASLPASAIAGRRVVVRGQVKGDSISTRPQPYNGVKITLVFTLQDGSTAYANQATVPDGTFDWRNFCFPVTVPANVAGARIKVGLEAVSGTAWFDELKVEADPAFFSETFENGTAVASTWTGSSYSFVGHGSGRALSVTNTNPAGSARITALLPAAACKGHRLLITGVIKATGVSAKPDPWNGIKLMITYTTAGGTIQYPQASIATGTFDWTPSHLVVPLPADVTSINLTLGLEKVTGTVAFDDIKIETAPLLATDYFDDANVASRWSGGPHALITRNTGKAMEITNPAASASNLLNLALPAASIRGRQVTLRALVKATGVSQPPNSWNGIKAMLTITTPSGTSYPQVAIPPGTFDWKVFQGEFAVPADATAVSLTLGLQLSSGTVAFDDVQIKADTFSPYWTNPTPNHKGHGLPALRGVMVDTDLNQAYVGVLASWKVNLVRWQLGKTTYSDALLRTDYDTILLAELAKLDAVLPALRAAGIAVVLDLHSLSEGLFASGAAQQKLIDTWRLLAARYKTGGSNSDGVAIWAYDLANEPDQAAWTENLLNWNELAERTALAVREIDPAKTIIVESILGEVVRFPWLRPVRTGRVMYSFHYYRPWTYAAQGLDIAQPYTPVAYPGTIDGAAWNRARIAADFQAVADFQNRHGVAIYVGEFSAVRWAPGGAAYLADCMSVFEENGWDWSYHAFREWQGWSAEIDAATPRGSSTPSATTTDRLQAMLDVFSLNTPFTP